MNTVNSNSSCVHNETRAAHEMKSSGIVFIVWHSIVVEVVSVTGPNKQSHRIVLNAMGCILSGVQNYIIIRLQSDAVK